MQVTFYKQKDTTLKDIFDEVQEYLENFSEEFKDNVLSFDYSSKTFYLKQSSDHFIIPKESHVRFVNISLGEDTSIAVKLKNYENFITLKYYVDFNKIQKMECMQYIYL